jgi:hypothetical protein
MPVKKLFDVGQGEVIETNGLLYPRGEKDWSVFLYINAMCLA